MVMHMRYTLLMLVALLGVMNPPNRPPGNNPPGDESRPATGPATVPCVYPDCEGEGTGTGFSTGARSVPGCSTTALIAVPLPRAAKRASTSISFQRLIMSDGGIIDATAGVANSIGRYFSVVSFIPSSLYVLFVYLLVASGSWRHPPDWSHAFVSLGHLGIDGVVLLTFLGVGLGIFIHPIQFSIVQFFEGYWGTWPISQAIRYRRIVHYQRISQKLDRDVRSPKKIRHRLEGRQRSRQPSVCARRFALRATRRIVFAYIPGRSRRGHAHAAWQCTTTR